MVTRQLQETAFLLPLSSHRVGSHASGTAGSHPRWQEDAGRGRCSQESREASRGDSPEQQETHALAEAF